MPVSFQKATKRQSKLRLALIGPSGSGKTYSALAIAKGLGGRVALIDTEHGSASKYAHLFDFDTLALESFAPETYIEAISAAEAAGYDVLIIDSISHAWAGKGGVLEFVDQQKLKGGADPTGWGKATPKQNAFVDKMLSASERAVHLIVTMRSKMTIALDVDEKTHKTVIRRLGMQPIQRDGLEYEFDLVGDMDQDNTFTVSKSRCENIAVGQTFDKPGAQLAATLRTWLDAGAPIPPAAPKPAQPEPKPATSTTKAPEPGIQNGKPRPYDPAYLHERFIGIVAAEKTTPVKEGFKGLVAHWLDLCFAGQDSAEQKRHSLTGYLTGKLSTNELTPAELRAFKDWLRPVEDSGGGWKIDGLAEQEAQAIITQVMLESGQGTLPLEADPAESGEEIPF